MPWNKYSRASCIGILRHFPSVLTSFLNLGLCARFLLRLDLDRNVFERFVANKVFHLRLDQ